eukprot:gene15929-15625_t
MSHAARGPPAPSVLRELLAEFNSKKQHVTASAAAAVVSLAGAAAAAIFLHQLPAAVAAGRPRL